MECFNGFWSRRVEEERIPCDLSPCTPTLPLAPPEGCRSKTYRWYLQYIVRKHSTDIDSDFDPNHEDDHHDSETSSDTMENFKKTLKHKASKHAEFYKNLLNNEQHHPSDDERTTSSSPHQQSDFHAGSQQSDSTGEPSRSRQTRQRRTGVVQMHQDIQQPQEELEHKFPSVEKFILQYTELIHQQMDKIDNNRTKVVSNNLAPPPSGYCSSSNASDDEGRTWGDEKRCCSSDSALGLLQSDEEASQNPEASEEHDVIPELSDFSSSKRGSIDHCNVPSKTLIEAQYVPFPLDRKLSDCDSVDESEGKFESRRQSCFTDDGEEPPRYRYWRTPSVVVSDYSDDVIGGFLTFEELEYFRNHRKDVSSPDSSLNSSCSNLNYCGSSVSVLDAEYTLRTPSRKASDCSSCSTVSGDEDNLDNVDNHLQPLTTTVYGNKVSAFLFIKV